MFLPVKEKPVISGARIKMFWHTLEEAQEAAEAVHGREDSQSFRRLTRLSVLKP